MSDLCGMQEWMELSLSDYSLRFCFALRENNYSCRWSWSNALQPLTRNIFKAERKTERMKKDYKGILKSFGGKISA